MSSEVFFASAVWELKTGESKIASCIFHLGKPIHDAKELVETAYTFIFQNSPKPLQEDLGKDCGATKLTLLSLTSLGDGGKAGDCFLVSWLLVDPQNQVASGYFSELVFLGTDDDSFASHDNFLRLIKELEKKHEGRQPRVLFLQPVGCRNVSGKKM